jgi:hypothetical protein
VESDTIPGAFGWAGFDSPRYRLTELFSEAFRIHFRVDIAAPCATIMELVWAKSLTFGSSHGLSWIIATL